MVFSLVIEEAVFEFTVFAVAFGRWVIVSDIAKGFAVADSDQ